MEEASEGRPRLRDESPEPWILLGEAVLEAWRTGRRSGSLTVLSDAHPPDELPVAHFFRSFDALPALERAALERARGRVLDVGAGAGAHALILQERGRTVTALERSPAAVEVLRERGVADARSGDACDGAFAADGERWDTILLLMNGTTLVGSPERLVRLLSTLESRLSPGGRILVDSVDLRPGGDDADRLRDDGRYVGEIQLQLDWRGRRSRPWPVLYADPGLLSACCSEAGLGVQETVEGEEGAYLAVLVRSS